MINLRASRVIPLSTLLFACVFLYLGVTRFGFWHDAVGPLPGFVPSIIAALLIPVSLLALLQSGKAKPVRYSRSCYTVVLGVAAVMASTFLIGMIPSLALYLVVWLRRFGKASWRQTVITTFIMMGITIGVFVAWLNVPFPKGVLGQFLFP